MKVVEWEPMPGALTSLGSTVIPEGAAERKRLLPPDVIVPKLLVLTENKARPYLGTDFCVHAAEALGMLGPAARAAVPRLRQLAEDEENEIAEAATRALERIERK